MGEHRTLAGRFAALIGTAALALPLAALSGAAATTTAAVAHKTVTARMTPAIGNPVSFVRAGRVVPGTTPTFRCQAPASATNVLPCYGPAQIRAAYNVPGGLTGKGKTIVIIDAFQSPTIQSDLATFDSAFGIPAPPAFNIIAPQGLTAFDNTNPNQVGWAGEISLDVEWAHAIAPGATIDLVLSKSDQDTDIFNAQHYVISHDLGDVLSQSFGENESCMDPTLRARTHRLFGLAALERMSVFASAGDDGSAALNCPQTAFVEAVNTPASDPLVTSVGGTHLSADFSTGAYQSETVWNDSGEPLNDPVEGDLDFGATGGGFSVLNAKPFYQYGTVPGHARGVPDVSYNGDVFGGVLGACSSCVPGTTIPGAVFIFGGTSAGSPQWAAITALADQAAHHRLGLINPALYAIGHNPFAARFAFHDVTTGNNSWDVAGFVNGTPVPGYSAQKGWDPASGLGSPNVAHLISLLAH